MAKNLEIQLLRTTVSKLSTELLKAGEPALTEDNHLWIGSQDGLSNIDLGSAESLLYNDIYNILASTDINGAINETALLTLNNLKSIMSNSMKLASINDQEFNPELEFFIDSFNDDEDIDPQSTNYNLNRELGYVELIQGGNFSVIETNLNQFNNGTFNNTEVFSLEDGALRKSKTIVGNVNNIEDFEDTSNVFMLKPNRFYHDDFENGDVSHWYFEMLSNDANTGLSSDTNYINGNYGIRIDANDRAYSPSIDCSDKSNVILQIHCAGVSLDDPDEQLKIGWYDGTNWHDVITVHNNDNQTFLYEIPDTWLSNDNMIVADLTDNATLFGGTNGIADSGYIDDIQLFETAKIQLPQTSKQSEVYEGDYAGNIAIDFSDESVNGSQSIQIDLGTPLDFSSYKYLKLYHLKQDKNLLQYYITLEDSFGATYSYSPTNLIQDSVYQEINLLLTDSFSTIDETTIKYIYYTVFEDTTNNIILDVDTTGTSSLEIRNDRILKQTFKVTENVTCQRIKLKVKWEHDEPLDDLHIALANIFDTTLTTGRLDKSIPSDVFGEYIIEFDSPVNLFVGNSYSIKIISPITNGSNGWDVGKTNSGERYTDGVFYYNTADRNDSLRFQLIKPIIKEHIFIDLLQIEAESTYNTTGTYISDAINLGLTPDSLDTVLWDLIDNGNDDVNIRVKFATDEVGLITASWSGLLSNGADISSITPYQYFQYQLEWSNGDSTNSDVVKSITMNYNVNGSTGQAIIISKPVSTTESPNKFILRYEHSLGSGTITYYVSKDGGITWQIVSNEGVYQDFIATSGTSLSVKALITGNAKLLAYSLATDKPII